jgi:chromosome segregation ATPase
LKNQIPFYKKKLANRKEQLTDIDDELRQIQVQLQVITDEVEPELEALSKRVEAATDPDKETLQNTQEEAKELMGEIDDLNFRLT